MVGLLWAVVAPLEFWREKGFFPTVGVHVSPNCAHV